MLKPKSPKPRKCQAKDCPVITTNRYAMTVACSPEHAISVAKARRIKKERKAMREDRERIKTLATLCKEARKVVQKWCRLRDSKYGTCICCGVPRIDDGAHRFPVGTKYRTARISLNPEQINGACSKCNRFVGGGNVDGYDAGLVARYGPQKLVELKELKRRADQKEDAPLTKEEVKEIKAYYAKKIREFEMERL